MQTDYKIRYILPLMLSFCGIDTPAQTLPNSTENYVYTKTYLSDPTLPNPRVSETVQYLDGLGRPKQTIAVKASPTGKDIVQHFEYDALGRPLKSYLPIPQPGTQNGDIYANPLANAASQYGAEKIYSEKIIENSPLQRMIQTYGVGNEWSSKPVTYAYETNTDADAVKKYNVITTWVESRTQDDVSVSGKHPSNTLTKNAVTDEDGNTTTQFTNALGQMVMTRKQNGTQPSLDTYYVYNEWRQQVLVIPPLASASTALTPSVIEALCYQYRYDAWGRLAEKKLPGKGWEYFVYDKQDRLIMTQDTNMKNGAINWGADLWLFTKYDKFGRVLYTGITTGGDRNAVQLAVNSGVSNTQNNESKSASPLTYSNMEVYYSNTAYPTNIVSILSVNYYDTYPSGTPAIPTQVLGQNVLTQDAQSSNISTKSLPTASFVRNVENDSWTKNYIWYDEKARAVGTHTINHLGGYTKTETLLDFAGVPQRNNTYHQRDGNTAEVQVQERFVYNAQNMLLKHYHQVDNNAEELLAENSYNEKGQLTNKKVGNNLQSIDYSYNIRGWMTGINDPTNLNGKLFGYDIHYQNPTDAGISPKRYNGNISEVNWRVSSNSILKRYAYQYDGLNRLTIGTFLNPDFAVPQNNWNNEEVTYDNNGNIESLTRNAKSFYGNNSEKIDDLEYYYSGNRLLKVVDNTGNPTGYEVGGNTIEYDDNGNMKTMLDKQINQIGYNFLNLPNAMKIEDTKKKILYLYRADGTKLRKTFNFLKQDGSVYTTITDYLDGFQYLSTVGSKPNELDPIKFAYEQEAFMEESVSEKPFPVLSFFPTAEGFYDYDGKEYIYQYKDHLGNVRVSYKRDLNGLAEITDQNDYYPFGMNIPREEKAIFGTNSLYNHKYNGKELQETGFSDYGWRQYQSDIGRWFGMDQLAESYTSFSPYAYVGNNPIMRTDPDGRKIVYNEGMREMEAELRNWKNSGGFGGGFASYFAGGGSGFSSAMNAYLGNIGSGWGTGSSGGSSGTLVVGALSGYRGEGNGVMITGIAINMLMNYHG
ncbi:MAG: RHS repeat-associated core domain-containing protein [Pedobacter sp.]|nr:MAG: RHS repeat-associated core domain-containing protein [Pedobacter sp.]